MMSSHEHPANPLWIWSGVHGDSGEVHPFLAIRDDLDRDDTGLNDFLGIVNLMLAGSGGLLLIKRSWKRSCKNRSPSDDTNNSLEAVQGQPSPEVDQHWKLVVVNPSTDESRFLPPANSMDVGLRFWSYRGVQANLLVNTETQTYTVTLTFPDCVCLYSSTSNAWRCQRFKQGPWGPHNPELLANPWKTQITSAYVNGRLFFADVVIKDSIPTMNLIEIDAEAGSWKLHNWHYSLRTISAELEFLDTPFHRMRGLTDHGMHQVLRHRTLALLHRDNCVPDSVLKLFQIVECMGELYAVIPMSLNEYLPMSLRSRRTLTTVVEEYDNFELNFTPLQFLIVSMRGDGFVHGVLRILLPEDMTSLGDQSEEDIDTEDEEDYPSHEEEKDSVRHYNCWKCWGSSGQNHWANIVGISVAWRKVA